MARYRNFRSESTENGEGKHHGNLVDGKQEVGMG